jgi:hypothetical protein
MLQAPNEPVSACRHCLDVPGVLSRITQRPPELVYGGVQPALEIDEGAFVPKLLPQLVPGNQVAGMFQQQKQNPKRLSGQPDTNSALP